MNKIKVTNKTIRNSYVKIYQCCYCDLEPLYHYSDTKFYTSGIYGWNFDIFEFGNIAILSGYRNMFGAELPIRCKQILKEAQNWYKTNLEPIDLDYLRSEFEKALTEDILN